jgi:hypothetical protein
MTLRLMRKRRNVTSIIEPTLRVNGQVLEIVDTFKFLGVHIDREGKFKIHINARRSAFFSGLSEIEGLGLYENDLPVNMKSLL